MLIDERDLEETARQLAEDLQAILNERGMDSDRFSFALMLFGNDISHMACASNFEPKAVLAAVKQWLESQEVPPCGT